jgi:phosphoribosylaminoimidazole (AIR) synthetase
VSARALRLIFLMLGGTALVVAFGLTTWQTVGIMLIAMAVMPDD